MCGSDGQGFFNMCTKVATVQFEAVAGLKPREGIIPRHGVWRFNRGALGRKALRVTPRGKHWLTVYRAHASLYVRLRREYF